MRRRRVAIIFDGSRWFVRRIRITHHDANNNEMIYRCDAPISNDHRSALEALRSAKRWLRSKSR